MPSPELTRREPERETRGMVLMLHGGAKAGLNPVGNRSASFRRASSMRDALEPKVLAEGLSLWLLRFGVRGWNAEVGTEPSLCRTPAGPWTGPRRSTTGFPWSCSDTPWALAPPYTSRATAAGTGSPRRG
jgi:hypothetical protein